MRPAALAAVAALSLLAAAPSALADDAVSVSVQFAAFAPTEVDALPGETVLWSNGSERTHTVTADDGSFDSGELGGGATFSHAFAAPGAFAYHCTIHPGMNGIVDVRRVILDFIPPAAVPAGQAVELTGRVAEPGAKVTIERDPGSGFRPVATAKADAAGRWTGTVTAIASSDYRATSGTDASRPWRLLVTDRTVHVRATKTGLVATVTPRDPNATVVLQEHLRDRFGWWPSQRVRLDYLSRAEFHLARPVLARVALVDERDGWTPIALSPPVRARPRR